MPKLTAPLTSLRARGTLARLLTFVTRRKQNIVELKPIPVDAKSPAQLAWRPMFLKCVDLWHTLTDLEKQNWERTATPRHMTGYAWFMSQCLGPNPGIYLPLAGGTMTGNINMSTHKIIDLPDPANLQDADTKAGRDGAITTHKGDASAHHTVFTPTDHQADAHNMTLDGVDLSAHAANASAHHTKTTSVTDLTDHNKTVHDALNINAATLETSTKAQVQDHTPKAHTLASHSTKAHSELTDIGASDHHTRYSDAEALAATVQSGAITNGVTKAPTHDAVYDVKVTADDAQTAAEVDADIATHTAIPAAHHTAFTPTDHQADAHTMTLDGVDLSAHATNASAHHTKYTDAEALAAAVQSGAITNGVTKAPTHDAVYDVKVTADDAQTAAEVDADIATHAALTTTHGAVSAATADRIVVRDNAARAKFAAPAASGDALIKGTRLTAAEMLDGTSGKVLTAQGAGVNPIYATIPPSMTFTDYHYYANLATTATYTPPAHAITTLFTTSGVFTAASRHMEFWDGASWVDTIASVSYESYMTILQDTAQNTRIHNASASAGKISLTGVTWS